MWYNKNKDIAISLLSDGKNKMRKFFVKSEKIKEDKFEIVGSDVNHIKNVLRLQKGDQIEIGNAETQENYQAEILTIGKDFVEGKILKKLESVTEGKVELHIFQGIPKADKMELIIQKGTELGVSKIIPVCFQRSIVKLTEKEVPTVDYPQKIKEICALIPHYDVFLLAYEQEMQNSLKHELQKIDTTKEKLKIAVAIGPEGGIETEEVDAFKQAGAKVISLGKRILRTETVALQVSSIIMYELE